MSLEHLHKVQQVCIAIGAICYAIGCVGAIAKEPQIGVWFGIIGAAVFFVAAIVTVIGIVRQNRL